MGDITAGDMRYGVAFLSEGGTILDHLVMYDTKPDDVIMGDLIRELATDESLGMIDRVGGCEVIILDRKNEKDAPFFEWIDTDVIPNETVIEHGTRDG